MAKVIGIQFQKNGKLYYFDANGFVPKTGDYVIVDTARGNDLGEVTMGPREIDEESWRGPLKKTVRIATEQDIQHGVENRQKEKEAFSICQKKIAEHKLEMKLVSVEYAFDNSKILFFFTANGRVDFRSLVKDLASIFKMRIELRQIGVRDEAKMLGGLGPCGRPICCGTFSSSGVCPRYASSRSDCVAFRNDHSRRVSMASALSMSDGLPQKNCSVPGDCAATSAPVPRSSRVEPTSAFSICHSNDCSFVTLVLMPPSPFPSPLRR